MAKYVSCVVFFFFSSRRRHTRLQGDWSSDVCSSDLSTSPGATAQLVDEGLVQPGLVDLQRGVGQQAVAVEALDVVALEGRAVTPDVDVVFLHGGHQHGAGHGTAQGRGVEVGDAARGDVEGAGLDGGNAFAGQLRAAVDQACLRSEEHTSDLQSPCNLVCRL